MHTCHFSIIFLSPLLGASFPVQTCPNLWREGKRDGTTVVQKKIKKDCACVGVMTSKSRRRHTFVCYFQACACSTSAVFLYFPSDLRATFPPLQSMTPADQWPDFFFHTHISRRPALLCLLLASVHHLLSLRNIGGNENNSGTNSQ